MRPSTIQALPARFPTRADLVAAILVFAALVVVAEASREALEPLPEAGLAAVRLSAVSLPAYAAQTVVRMFAALAFSLLFTFTYATLAAKSAFAERLLMPLLDILQSVPILGFISVTVTFFLSLTPGRMAGRSSPRSSPSSPVRPGTWRSASTSRCAPYRRS